MQIFEDDDDGYIEWLTRNPNDFVINTQRPPSPSYLRLHRAECRLISGTPANGSQWTHRYMKACGRREELESWVESQVGGEIWVCPRCTS